MQETEPTDSAMPRDLARSPRTVRRKRGTLGLIVLGQILTAPALATILALAAFAVFDPIVVFLLPVQPAHVISLSSEFKLRRGTNYSIDYELDQTHIIGRDEVMPAEYRAFQIGRLINVHMIHLGPLSYSALDRSLSAYAHFRMILWFSVSFALAIGWVLFQGIWLLPARSHWLARNGTATFGAVVEKSAIRVRRRHASFTLTYQFKAGGKLHARRIIISPQRFDATAARDLVIILFDPARPGRSIVYDYCDFVVT